MLMLPSRAARRALTVLALESSADDSCAAIVTSTRRILANVVIRQDKLSAPLSSAACLHLVHTTNSQKRDPRRHPPLHCA